MGEFDKHYWNPCNFTAYHLGLAVSIGERIGIVSHHIYFISTEKYHTHTVLLESTEIPAISPEYIWLYKVVEFVSPYMLMLRSWIFSNLKIPVNFIGYFKPFMFKFFFILFIFRYPFRVLICRIYMSKDRPEETFVVVILCVDDCFLEHNMSMYFYI